jgi:hypothetical protein
MKAVSVRRFLCGVAGALAVAASAFAQQAATPSSLVPPAFGLLSLVGDKFSVVFRREEIGSRLDPNDRRGFALDASTLDDIALSAAEDVLKRLKPVSPVLRFSIRDLRLFALQDKLLVDSAESRGMREALAKLLRENGATRLVLVTKWRDDAQFKLVSGTTGTGKISGLGFYVDSSMRIRNVDSGESTHGFLGPYAFVQFAIVDVASMAPVKSVLARESQMNIPLAATGAVRAWDALTPEGKVEALERVLRRAVQDATAAALAD